MMSSIFFTTFTTLVFFYNILYLLIKKEYLTKSFVSGPEIKTSKNKTRDARIKVKRLTDEKRNHLIHINTDSITLWRAGVLSPARLAAPTPAPSSNTIGVDGPSTEDRKAML